MATTSPAVNPESGSTLTVPMGQTLFIELTFENPSAKLRTYDLSVAGPATGFASLETTEIHVGPFETGVARVQISPTGQTTPDDYPLVVRITEDGELVDPPGEVSLLIEVEYAEVVDLAALEAERLAEEARQQAEAARIAEQKRIEDEKAAEIEAARLAELRRVEEEAARLAEEQRIEQERAAEIEEARLAELRRAEEEAARLAEEQRAEQKRAAELTAAQEAERLRQQEAKLAEEEAARIAEAKRLKDAEAEEEAQRIEAENAAAILAAQEAAAAEAAAVARAAALAEETKRKAELEAAEIAAEAERQASLKEAEEAEAILRQEEEARIRAAEEAEEIERRAAEAKKLAEEEAKEEETRRRAAEEAKEAERKAAEAQRLAEEEAEAKRRQDEDARRRAAEEAAEEERRREAEAKKVAAEEQRRAAEEARKQEMARKADEERARMEAEAMARAAEEEAEAKRRAQAEADRLAREEQARIEAAKKLKEEEALAREIEVPTIAVVDGNQVLGGPVSTEKQALVGDFKADRIITDAKSGTQVLVKPGETVLLKFTVRHEVQKGQRPASRTFRLQHNRALKEHWIDIVVPTLNVKPNGTGELAVMLRPPLDAEPANYPFAVEVGVQGQVFVPSQYVLTVQPVPMVQLEAEQSTVKIGPFGRSVPFALKVNSAGNSETAYRLAVKDPLAGQSDDPLQHEDLYESGAWQYNFDRELSDLVSQTSDGKATPQKHQLTARRRGIWWFGFVEKHPMRVAAVPVTDTANGHKAGNEIQLTAKRWRLIPMAAFLFWPLVLLLWMYFTGGSTAIEVMNGYPTDDRRVIVLANSLVPKGQEASIPLQLKIERSSMLPPKLFLTQGERTRELPFREGQTISLGANDYVTSGQLVLKDFFGRQIQSIDLTAFGYRTDNYLFFARFDEATQAPVLMTAQPDWVEIRDEETGARTGNATVKTFIISIPPNGARRLYLMNNSPARLSLTVQLSITKRPRSNFFSVSDFGQDEAKVESLQSQAFGGPLFQFKGDASEVAAANALPEEERTWELVSTNGPERVMRFVLQAEVPE